MNLHNNLSSFDTAFEELYHDILVEPPSQDSRHEKQFTHQGISVQVLPSYSVYNNQSDIDQNEAPGFNSLNVYDIEILTPDVSSDSLLKDMLEVTEYTSGECRPWNSGNKNVNNEPSSIPHTNAIQPFLTGTEPEIEKPMPAHHSNPGYQLTDLPAILSNPQELPADSEVNPLNLHHATSDNQNTPAEAVTDANASIVDCQSVCRRSCQKEHRKDPAYMQQLRKRQREWVRERRKDPAFLERQREQAKERRKDPAYAERKRKRAREYRKDPANVERQRKRRIELASDRRNRVSILMHLRKRQEALESKLQKNS